MKFKSEQELRDYVRAANLIYYAQRKEQIDSDYQENRSLSSLVNSLAEKKTIDGKLVKVLSKSNIDYLVKRNERKV